MRTKGLILLTCVLCVCYVNGQANTANRTDNGEDVVTDNEEETDPLIKGMDPLFQMTNVFLDLVNPEGETGLIDALITAAGLESQFKARAGCSKNSSVLDDYLTPAFDSFSGDEAWPKVQEFIAQYPGISACIIIGLLFIIIMPIAGFIVCCCRCCCRTCGGKTAPPAKSDKCMRIVCSILLVIVNTLLLAGMVCAFVTNELIRQQTSNEASTKGFGNNLNGNLGSVSDWAVSAVSELKSEVNVAIDGQLSNVVKKLNGAPQAARERVSDVADTGPILDSAQLLAQSTTRINESLTEVNRSTTNLQDTQAEVNTILDDERTKITNTLNGINDCSAACEELKTIVNALGSDANFSNLQDQVDDIRDQLANIEDVVDADLIALINKGESEFHEIAGKVENDTEDRIQEVVASTEEIKTAVDDEMDSNVDSYVDSITDVLNDVRANVTEYAGYVNTWGQYYWYAGLGVSCILLLIVLLNYLGLLLGLCSEQPSSDAGTCNKGVGANLIVSSIAFQFLFGWLLMLIVLVFFAAGGWVTHTEICRPIAKFEPQSSLIMLIDDLVGLPGNGSRCISDVVNQCEDNEAIYTAMGLDEYTDLDQALSIDEYDVDDKLAELDTVLVDLSSTEIVDAETVTQLESLRDAGLDDIDFDSFVTELEKDLITVDLNDLTSKLDDYAATQPNNDPNAAILMQSSQALKNLQSGQITDMNAYKDDLQTALDQLEIDVKDQPGSGQTFSGLAQGVIDALQTTEQRVQVNGSKIVNDYIKELTMELKGNIKDGLDNLKVKIKNNIGRCQPLYKAFVSVTDVVCVDFLYPFNGFWFSIGWCLFFFIFAISIGFPVVGLYRKKEDYSDHKSFDDPMDRHKHPAETNSERMSDRGVSNAGYRDDRGHYPDYSGHRNGGYPSRGNYAAENNGRGRGRYYHETPQNPYPSNPPPHYYNNKNSRMY